MVDWNAVTAVGTVAVAIAAVGIAIWGERNTDRRIKAERQRSDKILADERALADKRLAEQLAHSASQLAVERTDADTRLRKELEHADARVAAERQAAQDAEQLAEAWSVQVIGARMPPGDNVISPPENPSERPVVVVVNRGRYTITRVEAQFCDGQATLGSAMPQGFADFATFPKALAGDFTGALGEAYSGVLTPGGAMRIIGDSMLVRYLRGVYPIVRWRDRWDQQWEHRKGQVRQVPEGEQWTP